MTHTKVPSTLRGVEATNAITNLCAPLRIQPEFSELVDALLKRLTAQFGARLHSVYLYGSVARGQARPYHSDLDVSLLLSAPSTEDQPVFKAIAAGLAADYPVVSKVDLDLGYVAEVRHWREKYRWQFWLTHCCCCVWGQDLSAEFSPLAPNQLIGNELNYDLKQVMQTTLATLTEQNAPVRGKMAAKKILRSAYLSVAEKDGSWYSDLNSMLDVSVAYYPQEASALQNAFQIAQGERSSLAQVAAMLEYFASSELATQLETAPRYSQNSNQNNSEVITIRDFMPADAKALWEVYFHTIRNINCRDYSPQQVQAWAPRDFDFALWQKRVTELKPFVALVNGVIAGYSDLQQDGLIDHFFCHHQFQGKGVGRALMSHIFALGEQRGITRYYSHVSLTARPFYERMGFEVVKQQTLDVRGQQLTNFVMQKQRV